MRVLRIMTVFHDGVSLSETRVEYSLDFCLKMSYEQVKFLMRGPHIYMRLFIASVCPSYTDRILWQQKDTATPLWKV